MNRPTTNHIYAFTVGFTDLLGSSALIGVVIGIRLARMRLCAGAHKYLAPTKIVRTSIGFTSW